MNKQATQVRVNITYTLNAIYLIVGHLTVTTFPTQKGEEARCVSGFSLTRQFKNQ